jgi:Protein of unknown function (DUF3131)
MRQQRCSSLAMTLFLALFSPSIFAPQREQGPTREMQKDADNQNGVSPPAKNENPSGARDDEPDTSGVFSRGIILPDNWVEPKDGVPPVVPIPVDLLPLAPPPASKTSESAIAGPEPAFGTGEDEIAHRAWRYLIASREPATGLYDSVFRYPAATMWDMGSGLAALVSAERLGLLSPISFGSQMRQLLSSLEKMPLYNHELPNREYNVRTLAMLDRESKPSQIGTGWSALDLGRVLIWLRIVSKWYPEMKPQCERIVAGWNFSRLRLNGEANGTALENGKEYIRQEGRLGYEQYAAKGFALWGIGLARASGYAHSKSVVVMGLSLSQDDRSHSFLTGDPFFLAQMEVGSIDTVFDHLTADIFEVQRRRWQKTGILTAISEDAVSLKPWFVYNTILYNDREWQCVSPGGKTYPELKGLSTKAALAYAALHDDEYARKLQQATEKLVHPHYGYYAGQYDKGGVNVSLNLNTNAIVLEAMLYRKLERRAFLRSAAEAARNEVP